MCPSVVSVSEPVSDRFMLSQALPVAMNWVAASPLSDTDELRFRDWIQVYVSHPARIESLAPRISVPAAEKLLESWSDSPTWDTLYAPSVLPPPCAETPSLSEADCPHVKLPDPPLIAPPVP